MRLAAKAALVTGAIFDGVENEEGPISPGPMAHFMAEGWRSSAITAFERQMAALALAVPGTL